MRDLANVIARQVGYSGSVLWDPSKPNRQPRRQLYTSVARRELGFEAAWNLREGLAETIAWTQHAFA